VVVETPRIPTPAHSSHDLLCDENLTLTSPHLLERVPRSDNLRRWPYFRWMNKRATHIARIVATIIMAACAEKPAAEPGERDVVTDSIAAGTAPAVPPAPRRALSDTAHLLGSWGADPRNADLIFWPGHEMRFRDDSTVIYRYQIKWDTIIAFAGSRVRKLEVGKYNLDTLLLREHGRVPFGEYRIFFRRNSENSK
jgi:hypothetical protein